MITIEKARQIIKVGAEVKALEAQLDTLIHEALIKQWETTSIIVDSYELRDELQRRYSAQGWITKTTESDRAHAAVEFKLTIIVMQTLRSKPEDPEPDVEPLPEPTPEVRGANNSQGAFLSR